MSKVEVPCIGRAAHATPQPRYRLVVQSSDGAITYYPLEGSLSVGRGDDNDIVLKESAASRLHCVVNLVGDRPCVIDQTSTNGTYLNGSKITHAWLNAHDALRIGHSSLTVELLGPRGTATRQESPQPMPTAAPPPPGLGSSDIQLQLVYELGGLLTSSVDVGSAARAVAELALEAFPVERVFVLILDEGGPAAEPQIVAAATRPGHDAPPGEPSRTVVARALEQGEAVHCFDIASDEPLSKARSLTRAQARTVLCAPLRLGESIIGALYCDAPEVADGATLEASIGLYQTIADQAALAIGRARLHADLLAKNLELEQQRDALDDLNRRLDSRVKEKTALVARQARELEAKLLELERLQDARETMARALVHDIKNLVGAVAANITFLQGSVSEGTDEAQAAEDAAEGTRRIVALAEDVLAASQIESGALELLVQPLVVQQLFDAVARRLSRQAQDLGVELHIPPVQGGLMVTADSKLLGRVLDNLVGNALRHAGRSGRVSLSARWMARTVDVTVADTGPGVPEGERLKIFDEWHSSGSAATGQHGIGLHFCRLAVGAHGGTIRVEGHAGDNRFIASLPLRQIDDDSDITVSERPTLMGDEGP